MRPLVAALLALTLSIPVPAAAGELLKFDAGSLAELRTRHAGKPFILAFWSASCVPCREELPHWGEWQRRFPEIPVVLVATDAPDDQASVVAALRGAAPGGVELRSFASDFAEPIRRAVDRRWYGEVPRTYFFNAAHASEAHSGRLETARVDAWLRQQSARP